MNVSFISLILGIIAVWLLLFFILSGLSIFIRRIFGFKIDDIKPCFMDFWLGWAVSIAFLQIWHLFLKVDWRAFWFIFLIGISGLLWNHRIIRRIANNAGHINRYYYIILLLMAIWLAGCSILAPTIYDTGLYHLPFVRWVISSSIVPGLGNLSAFLAFNSSFFLYVSMLTSTLGWGSYHLANGLLVIVLFAQIFLSYHKLFKRDNGPIASHIFNALLLGPVLYLIFYVNVSNPTPDFPVFILGIVLTAQLIAVFEKRSICYKEKEDAYRIFSVATLAAVGMTIKQGFFITGIVILSIIFFICFHNRSQYELRKVFILSGGSAAVVLISWMIRNIILTGYVAFPIPFGSLPVEWRVPYADGMNTIKSIMAWSRVPHNTDYDTISKSWNWFIPWVIGIFHNFGIAVSLIWSSIGCALVLFYRFSKRSVMKTRRLTPLFLLPSLIYIPIWFLTAPNPRYLSSSLCILGAGTFTIAINNYGLFKNKIKFNTIFSLYLVLCSIFFLASCKKNLAEIFMQSKDGFCETAHVDVKPFVTNSGLIIYIPREGYQCWDAPLPCAPYPVADLDLRRKGNMYCGFVRIPNSQRKQ